MSSGSKRDGHVNELLKQLCTQQLTSADAAEVSRSYQRCCRMLDSKPFVGDEFQVS